MANLWTGAIETGGEFLSLEDETGLTFEEGKTYTLQIQDDAWVREGETGKGFYICDRRPFKYSPEGETLYIKANKVIVNIAE